MSEDRRKLRKVWADQLQESTWIFGNPQQPFGRAVIFCKSRRDTSYYTCVVPNHPIVEANLDSRASTLLKTPVIEEADISKLLKTQCRNEWDIIGATRLCVPYEPARTRKAYLQHLAKAYAALWESNHRTGENLK